MTATQQPVLETARLVLRPFLSSDAADVAKYAGDYDIARTTLRIPHPYSVPQAEDWISSLDNVFQEGKTVIFAIVPKTLNHIIGAVGLELCRTHDQAELGFWVGKPFWGQGYATEAARCVLQFGFQQLELNCVHAEHFIHNAASEKLMKKLGMKYEGTLRQRYKKYGTYVDCKAWSILKEEFHPTPDSQAGKM